MFELFAKGGWLLYPIILGSVIGVAIFLERLWALRSSKVLPSHLKQTLSEQIRNQRWSEARITCQQEQSSLSRVMLVALDQAERARNPESLKEKVEEAGQREAFILEKGIEALGVVASLEPLMGLLGTVLGMIDAFRKVEAGGVGDPSLVAQGVWKALLTTAAGLIVAIPVYIAYRFHRRLFEKRLLELQKVVSQLVEAIENQVWGSRKEISSHLPQPQEQMGLETP